MLPTWLRSLRRRFGFTTPVSLSRSVRPRLSLLEDRITPTKMYAVDAANGLFTFDSATPGTLTPTVTITGLQAGEIIQGLDSRPATGQLYGLGIIDNGATRTGRIYTINPATAVATQVGAAPFSTTLADTPFWGMDFNPAVDLIRLVNSNSQNLRVNPIDGTLVGTDTNLSVNGIDGIAYDRSFQGATKTTLYAYNFAIDQLSTIGGIDGNPTPNGGVVTNIGSTGIVASGTQQLDIESGTNIARLATNVGVTQTLFTVNLATGAATSVGLIGSGSLQLRGLASEIVVVSGTRMYAVTDTNALLTFGSAAPDVIAFNVAITGLLAGEKILGIDVRPATQQLYGLGIVDDGATRTGRIYTINPNTGAAVQVGAAPWSTTLEDTSFWGMDFNPNVDLIRVIGDGGSNFRVSPVTGALVGTDTMLNQLNIDDAAYTNTGGYAATTTLYGIRFADDRLKTIGGIDGSPSPNTGQVFDVGPTGISSLDAISMDIDAGTPSVPGVARASFRNAAGPPGASLYTINLATGAATLVGAIGPGPFSIFGLSTAQSALTVGGTANADTVVVTATGPNSGSYTLNGGTAIPFSDITSFSFIGGASDDSLTIFNPASDVFAPTNGVFFHGGGQSGDSLVLNGGGQIDSGSVNVTGPGAGTWTTSTGKPYTFTGTGRLTPNVLNTPVTVTGTAASEFLRLSRLGVIGTDFRISESGVTWLLMPFAQVGDIQVNGNLGNDRLEVDHTDDNLIGRTLTYSGGGGADSLLMNGKLNGKSSGVYNPGAADPNGFSGQIVHTSNGGFISTVNFTGLSPVEDLTVLANYTINAIAGNNTINVIDGPLSGGADPVTGLQEPTIEVNFNGAAELIRVRNKPAVIVNALGGADTMILNVINGTTGLTNLTLDSGDGTDVVDVRQTAATFTTLVTSSIGAGLTDFVTISNSGSVQGILGAVNVTNPPAFTALFIDDSADITGRVATVTAGNLTGLAPATISYNLTDLNSLAITGSAGADTFIVPSAVPLASLNGGGGSDTLVGPDLANDWNLTGANEGVIPGIVAGFASFENLTGGSQADSFNFAGGGSISGLMDGGGGADTLNYGGVAGAVHANLGISIAAAASFDGSQENPANLSPATGTATLNYNASTGLFDITATVNALATNFIGFHLHTGVAGQNGTIIVDLLAVPGATFNQTAGTFTYSATGVALPLLNEAEFLGDNTYLNLHTAAFPDGEVRGQVVRQTQAVTATTLASFTGSIANFEHATGGNGNDSLVGSNQVNVLNGNGGNDTIIAGPGGDTMTGGDNDDVLIWSNGDGSDVMDGGTGTDAVQVNGSVGGTGDSFLIQPGLAGRLRFDRTNFGAFNLDIGSTEALVVNGNNTGDTFNVNNLDGVSDLVAVSLRGNDGDDVFNVVPSSSVTIAVEGDQPRPPASPGDTLNVDLTGTTDSTLTNSSDGFGTSGSYTFTNRQPVLFRELETLGTAGTDLSVTVTDSQTFGVPGTSATYTIVVTNNGPLTAIGATISDTLGSLTGVTFTAVQAGGATGFTADGSGTINDVVTMPIGSTITYTVNGTLDPAATGTQTVTATVAEPIGQPDPIPANNTASDSNTLTPQADMSVLMSDTPDPVFLGANITYTITVTNGGPSDATSVLLSDLLPTNTTFVSFAAPGGWTATTPAVGGTGTVTASRASLAASAGDQVFTLVVRVNTNTPENSNIGNTATIETAAADLVPDNNSATVQTKAIPRPLPLVVGSDGGRVATVQVYDAFTGNLSFTTQPYGPGFTRGATVAAGDVTGDGVPDIIVGPGTGGGPHVRIFDGVTFADRGSFFAYDPSFRGGVFVAVGDTNGDGFGDVITGAGVGGGPHVRIVSGADLSTLASFFAYTPSFVGGVRVASGDFDGDNKDDIATAPGAGVGPNVKVFRGTDLVEVRSFFAYPDTFTRGVYVGAGDLNNDGIADLITGPGSGGGPHVKSFDGTSLAEFASFFAYSPQFRGGVRVAVADINGDNQADIVTGAGPSGGPHVKSFNGATLNELRSFFAFEADFTGGVFVG